MINDAEIQETYFYDLPEISVPSMFTYLIYNLLPEIVEDEVPWCFVSKSKYFCLYLFKKNEVKCTDVKSHLNPLLL
jgi:hypothetical protein